MPASSAQNSAPPGRILLVDDNRLGLMARKAVLEEHGFRVSTATHGAQALELFEQEPFDLVVTDYKMPGMHGVQLIEAIRLRSASVPIVLVSGYADALGLTEANTGADVVIAKSANEVNLLLRAVSRLTKRAASARKPPRAQKAAQAVRRQAAH